MTDVELSHWYSAKKAQADRLREIYARMSGPLRSDLEKKAVEAEWTCALFREEVLIDAARNFVNHG